jgi:hypothetical protein
MNTQLTASNGGFGKTSTYVSGVDDEGSMHEYGTEYMTIRANAAIVKGNVLSWVAPTATVPVSVTNMPTASGQLDFAGIAMESATAGKYVRVAVGGFALVDVASQTVASGEYLLKPTTTAGKGISASTAIDATTVAGTILGRFFGVKNAVTSLALAFIRPF